MVEDKEKSEPLSPSKGVFVSARKYLVKNLGAPFIVVFCLLVLLVAFMVAQGSLFVNDVAVIAYCFLVVGVVLQALSYLKYKSYERDFVGKEG